MEDSDDALQLASHDDGMVGCDGNDTGDGACSLMKLAHRAKLPLCWNIPYDHIARAIPFMLTGFISAAETSSAMRAFTQSRYIRSLIAIQFLYGGNKWFLISYIRFQDLLRDFPESIVVSVT